MTRKLGNISFRLVFANKNYVTAHDYSPKSIRCFKDLFIFVNNNEGKLSFEKEGVTIKEVKSIELEGLSTLWEIALQSPNSIVQERAGYLLATLYFLFMDKKSDKYWAKETAFVVGELMKIINSKPKDTYEKINRIKILREFIDTYETLSYPPHFKMFYKKLYVEEDDGEEEIMDSSYYNFMNYKWGKQTRAMIKVIHMETKEEKYININLKDTVIHLKWEIAKEFGVLPKEFEIYYGPKKVNFVQSYFDWNYIYELIKEIGNYPLFIINKF